MRFGGRVALVTGASAGIGYAVAEALVGEGASVVLTARGERGLVDATTALGPRTSYVAGDAAEDGTARRAVEHAVATYGGLDLVVCNAGVLLPGAVPTQPAAEVDRMIGVNLRGTIATVAAAAPVLAKGTDPAVVVITSSIGRTPAAGMGVYGATKAALHYLVPTWATELAEAGVRVNAVCAGITETPGLRATAEAIPGLREFVLAANLVKRVAEPAEIARPVLALLDARDTGFVTGSVWDVDGGHRRAGHGG